VSAKPLRKLKSLTLVMSFTVQDGRKHEETSLSGDCPSVADRSSGRRCRYATLPDADWLLVLSNGNATDFYSVAHRIASLPGDLVDLPTFSSFSSGPSVKIRYFTQNKSLILFLSWVHLRTGHDGTHGECMYKSTLSLTSALKGEGQSHVPAVLPSGKTG